MVPSFIKGIINLRGQILPVVDIRLCMGKPEVEYTNKTCIVVLNVDSISLGIVVDSVRQSWTSISRTYGPFLLSVSRSCWTAW